MSEAKICISCGDTYYGELRDYCFSCWLKKIARIGGYTTNEHTAR